MYENLDILRISSAMARHAGQRQAIVAQNVANADTPGYIARDLPSFAASYGSETASVGLRATRDQHMHGTRSGDILPAAIEITDQSSPNGNQVSIETEILKSVDAKRQHDRALAIYKTSLNVLRSSLRTN
jgi:flagellar basal-body rod protein FlgB